MRPIDLAREHSISTQAVRNYEQHGLIPPADRSPAGFRQYGDTHVRALRAYLALVAGFGYDHAGDIMRRVNRRDIAEALKTVSDGHVLLQRDRETLQQVRDAIDALTPPYGSENRAETPMDQPEIGWSIGRLAAHLHVTPATLRAWEHVGIVQPARDRAAGYRTYLAVDIRDAELAHLLRRGGYLLGQIADVVKQVRGAGSLEGLRLTLGDWEQRIEQRGLAMLAASAHLHDYLQRDYLQHDLPQREDLPRGVIPDED